MLVENFYDARKNIITLKKIISQPSCRSRGKNLAASNPVPVKKILTTKQLASVVGILMYIVTVVP